MVATLFSLNELPEAPSESRKIRGFRAALEDDDQPTPLYQLSVGGMSTDIDDRISSPSGMHPIKVSKLLLYPGVRSHHFYRFEGEEVTKVGSLNHHVTELAGLRSYNNLNKMDVIFSLSEAEEMEAALQSIIKATS